MNTSFISFLFGFARMEKVFLSFLQGFCNLKWNSCQLLNGNCNIWYSDRIEFWEIWIYLVCWWIFQCLQVEASSQKNLIHNLRQFNWYSSSAIVQNPFNSSTPIKNLRFGVQYRHSWNTNLFTRILYFPN